MVFVGSPKQLGFIPWLPTYPARGGHGPGATPVIGAPFGRLMPKRPRSRPGHLQRKKLHIEVAIKAITDEFVPLRRKANMPLIIDC